MRIAIIFLLAVAAGAQSLPNAVPAPYPRQQFVSSAGVPLAGAFLCTFAAGTSTPQATYTDSTAGTPNANPIVLDGNGSAQIWVGPQLYKFILYVGGNGACPGSGSVAFSADNIADTTLYFTNYVKTAGSATLISYTPPDGQAVTTVAAFLNNLPDQLTGFGCVGDNSTDNSTCLSTALNANSGRVLNCPVGTYLFSTQVNISGVTGGIFEGQGNSLSSSGGGCILKYTGTGDAFNVQKTTGMTFRDLTIVTAGNGVHQTASITTVGDTVLSNQYINVNVIGPGSSTTGSIGFWFNLTGSCSGGSCHGSDYYNTVADSTISDFDIGIKLDGQSNANFIHADNYVANTYAIYVTSNENNIVGGFINGGCSSTCYSIYFDTSNSFYNTAIGLNEDLGSTCHSYFFGAATFQNMLQLIINCGMAPIDNSAGANTILGRLQNNLTGNFTASGLTSGPFRTWNWNNFPQLAWNKADGTLLGTFNVDLAGTNGMGFASGAPGAVYHFYSANDLSTEFARFDSNNGNGLRFPNNYAIQWYHSSTPTTAGIFDGQIADDATTHEIWFNGGGNGSSSHPTLKVQATGGTVCDAGGNCPATWGTFFQVNAKTFAQLGSAVAGKFTWCSDCTVSSSPCTGSGSGAWAFSNASRWVCQAF